MKRATTLRAFGAAVLAITLTGCMKVDMQVELHTDDTVDGSIVLALSRDVMALGESMGQDQDSMLEDFSSELPEGSKVEEYEDDDFVGQRVILDNVPLSEFSESQDGEIDIVHDGNEFVVTGQMDMSDTGELGDTEGLEDQFGSDIEGFDFEGMMDNFEFSMSIRFPGEVLEHNGELDGTTVTWTPSLGENMEISARSLDSGADSGDDDGTPVWVWIVVAVAVVAALAGLLFFLSRNRRPEQPAAVTAQTAPTADAPPPPPAAPITQPTTPLPAQPEEPGPTPPADQPGPTPPADQPGATPSDDESR